MSSTDINDHSRYADAKPTELKGVEDITPEGIFFLFNINFTTSLAYFFPNPEIFLFLISYRYPPNDG